MYLVKTPLLLKWFYPQLTWNKDRSQKIIYLTFDDGPIPDVTTFVLKTLKEFEAKATFFCIGDNVKKHPDIFKEVINGGHSIGNHTFNHLKGWDTDDETYIENIKKCDQLVNSSLFRPPYGRAKKTQYAKLRKLFPQLEVIMWDVLSGDFDTKLQPEACLKNVINHVENGSIIVFHDSIKAFPRMEYALPHTLEFLQKHGYQFGTL